MQYFQYIQQRRRDIDLAASGCIEYKLSTRDAVALQFGSQILPIHQDQQLNMLNHVLYCKFHYICSERHTFCSQYIHLDLISVETLFHYYKTYTRDFETLLHLLKF